MVPSAGPAGGADAAVVQIETRSAWAVGRTLAAAPAAGSVPGTGTTADDRRVQARRAAERFVASARELLGSARTASATSPGAMPATWSAGTLGLHTASKPATLRSTAEVNTIATSYGTTAPAWSSGNAFATPTVSGTYTGTTDTTWTFKVTQVAVLGVLGSNKLTVTNSAGATVGNISFGLLENGNVHAVANGLSVSFALGGLTLGDTFTLDVRATVPTSLRPDKAMNATGTNAPNLDAGKVVTNGSFKVNGTTIAVAASDTVGQVLARITASAAGVAANDDGASDKVVLTHKTAGPAGAIDVTADTSGFVAALKLNGAALVAGSNPDADRPMAQVAALASVGAGSIVVDGTAVAFDPATDSLRTLLGRITAQTGVDAALANGDQVVTFTGRAHGVGMALSDGATGLLDALHISRRSMAPSDVRAVGARQRRELADDVAALRSDLSSLWTLAQSSDLTDLKRTLLSSISAMSARDRTLLQDLAGVEVKAGALHFDARDRDDIAAAVADAGRAGLLRLRQGSGSGGHRGLAGVLAAIGQNIERRTALV